MSSLDTYIFLFLYIILSTSLYSSSFNIFTSVYFIFLTTFITLLSFTFDHLTFSSRLTPFTMISIFSVLLTINYSGFTSVLFPLSLSTPIFQSDILLKLSAFPILLSRTYFSIKSNLDKYRAHLACLLFKFCVLSMDSECP